MKINLWKIINFAIPLLVVLAIAFGFGYYFYIGELNNSNDVGDAVQWACLGVLFVSPIFLIVGGFFAVLIKLIRTEIREQR